MINRQLMLIQRELWEHKKLYMAPLVLAGLIVLAAVLGFFVAVFKDKNVDLGVVLLEMTGTPAGLAGGGALVGLPVGLLNLVLAAVVFMYCLSALSAERNDKSILFWRSLPITDTETVVSKLLTALVVAPLLVAGIVIATQVVLLVLASLAILVGGGSPVDLLLGPLPFVQIWVLVLWIFITGSLWVAPLVAWVLLCTAFARRSVLVWAIALPVAIIIVEFIVFRSNTLSGLIGARFEGAATSALKVPDNLPRSDEAAFELLRSGGIDLLGLIAPGKFLANPGLWGGLVVAAAFVAGAIYCRRFRS